MVVRTCSKILDLFKDYKDCKVGRCLKHPLFIRQRIPRVSAYVLILRNYDIQIFWEPILDFLTPPSIFNIKNTDGKDISFRKFCKDMYKKKQIKFLRERIWNNLCRNVCIALMVLIPYIEDTPHNFQLLEFQFVMDK